MEWNGVPISRVSSNPQKKTYFFSAIEKEPYIYVTPFFLNDRAIGLMLKVEAATHELQEFRNQHD